MKAAVDRGTLAGQKVSLTSYNRENNGVKKVHNKKRGEKVQYLLNFPSTASSTVTCNVCGMSYNRLTKRDRETHNSYHEFSCGGISWSPSASDLVVLKSSVVHDTSKAEETIQDSNGVRKSKNVIKHVTIFEVNRKLRNQIRRVCEIVKYVNQELNAPSESDAWKLLEQGTIAGKAFIGVIDNLIIGVCITEPIEDASRSRWMILGRDIIVPNVVNHHAKIGISRIWVAKKWRRFGIAQLLLEAVLSNSVYGMKLDKASVSFSQPSPSGKMLAKKFNGAKHKSGEILIPVYLE